MKPTKHVIDGKLVATSPSAIEAFDETTSFGCQRKWWFQSVAGLKGPETASQALGTNLHATIEDYILQKKNTRTGETSRLFLAAKPFVDTIVEEGIIAVESWAELMLADVKIRGRIDVVTKTGILDWKTSSDIRQWAKTPGQLRTSTQMLLYAKWLDENVEKKLPAYTLEHVYVQTKGKPRVERVKAKIDRSSLDRGVEGIIVLLEQMKEAAAVTDVSKLKADRSKCRNCSFVNECPTESGSKENTMANLLSRLSKSETLSVLPPDAPKSDPQLAADPVPGYANPAHQAREDAMRAEMGSHAPAALIGEGPITTVVEATPTAPDPVAPSRRGRPPGAKNKMKYVDVVESDVKKSPLEPPTVFPDLSEKPAPTTESLLKASVPVAVKAPSPDGGWSPNNNWLTYQTVTVSHGATVPTAQFANQRIDVTLTARFEGDVDKATREVSAKCREKLIAELEAVALTLAGPKLKP